jgi:hypothetical protein
MEKVKVDPKGFSLLVSGVGVRGFDVVVRNLSVRYVRVRRTSKGPGLEQGSERITMD